MTVLAARKLHFEEFQEIQLFDSHNDHYLNTSEPLNSQQILYNKGSLKNVHLEEAKELGVCTGQLARVVRRTAGVKKSRHRLCFAQPPSQRTHASIYVQIFSGRL